MSFRVPWLVRLLRRVGFLLLVSASTAMVPQAALTMGGVPGTQRGSNPTLEGKYWRATELVGKPTPAQDSKREAHLMFQPLGRFTGSDGCNRLTGGYELKGDAISFGGMALTRMACEGTGDVERAFAEALKRAARVSVVAD